jgi:hypothetical protein
LTWSEHNTLHTSHEQTSDPKAQHEHPVLQFVDLVRRAGLSPDQAIELFCPTLEKSIDIPPAVPNSVQTTTTFDEALSAAKHGTEQISKLIQEGASKLQLEVVSHEVQNPH